MVRGRNEDRFAKVKSNGQKFKKGQVVRIAAKHNVFKRGFKTQFSEELYRVLRVYKHMPVPMYSVCALRDKDDYIIGRFYNEELTPVKFRRERDFDRIWRETETALQVTLKNDSKKIWIKKMNIVAE